MDLQDLHPTLNCSSLIRMALSIFVKKDNLPFAFYSSLMDAIKDNVKEYVLDSSKVDYSYLVTGRSKAKARAATKHFHESESSSDVDSSSAERIVAELEQRAFNRGRTESGSCKRLRWTLEEDKLLAQMYLKHKDQKLPFVAISSYFEDRSNNDCRDRFRSVARSNKLRNYSDEQVSEFILKYNI